MHALIQTLEALVFAVAASAFAHFGVTLKSAPVPDPQATVHRVPVSASANTTALAQADAASPCPLRRRVSHA